MTTTRLASLRRGGRRHGASCSWAVLLLVVWASVVVLWPDRPHNVLRDDGQMISKYKAQEAINRVNSELIGKDRSLLYNYQAPDLSNSFTSQLTAVKIDTATINRAARAAKKINAQLESRGVVGAGTPMPFMAFTHEIDINECPQDRRAHLCMSATQLRINKETGAVVSVVGQYVEPGEVEDEMGAKRLSLRVSAPSPEILDAGVGMVQKLIDDGNSFSWAPGGGMPFSAKVVIDIPNVPGFNLKHRIIGPSGSFIKHIEEKCGVRVFLRGRGSGFVEGAMGYEMPEPMFLYIAGYKRQHCAEAKALTHNLVMTIAEDYTEYAHVSRPGSQNPLNSIGSRQDSEMMTKLYGANLYATD